MSEPFVFDPRCEACKTPFGAVVCGQEILFHCRPLACEGFTHCALVLCHEFSQTRQEIELSIAGPEGDRHLFYRRRLRPRRAGADLVSLPPLAGRRQRLRPG